MARAATRRWHLTDVQRLPRAVAVAVACSSPFMVVGMGSGVLLVVALLLLVVVGLSIFLLGLPASTAGPGRPGRGPRGVGSGRPPAKQIVALRMRLARGLPGRASAERGMRDPAVTGDEVARVGQALPVEVDARIRASSGSGGTGSASTRRAPPGDDRPRRRPPTPLPF